MSKIAVIGPGAMGCLFAARFARAGHKTYLIDYRPQRAEALAKSGITVDEHHGSFAERVPVVFEDYEKAWGNLYPVKFEHVRSEMHTQFANIATPSEIVVTTTFAVEFGAELSV